MSSSSSWSENSDREVQGVDNSFDPMFMLDKYLQQDTQKEQDEAGTSNRQDQANANNAAEQPAGTSRQEEVRPPIPKIKIRLQKKLPITRILKHRLRFKGKELKFYVKFNTDNSLFPRWTVLDPKLYAREIYDYVSNVPALAFHSLTTKNEDVAYIMLHKPF